MSTSGDAAEQVVRLSIEGAEMAVKITGTAAKDIAAILTSVLKQSSNNIKTHGKTRLTTMLKSGNELKVFTMPLGDLKEFTKHAKDYGILYCVLKDKTRNDPEHQIDIIARADDAPKIQRIFDHYNLGKTEGRVWDKAKVKVETEQSREEKTSSRDKNYTAEHFRNPKEAKTEKGPLSEPYSENGRDLSKQGDIIQNEKLSVKEKLRHFKENDAKTEVRETAVDIKEKLKER